MPLRIPIARKNGAKPTSSEQPKEQQQVQKRKFEKAPCISKELYDEVPQSENAIVQLFYYMMHYTFIFLSKFHIGQVMISILDYYMVKILYTLDFCLPYPNCDFASDEIIERHKKLPTRERPMAWLFFIPALIFLRILRFVLSVYKILFENGSEFTSSMMQIKVSSFRRYYRSIRHYAVDAWSDKELEKIEKRKSDFFGWRIYYAIYSVIFLTKPLVENHNHSDDIYEHTEVKANGHDKNELNVSKSDDGSNNSSSDSDDELDANEMLKKYGELDDSQQDPDYIPDKLDTTSETIDSFDEKTESQQLEHEFSNNPEDAKAMNSTFSSDIEPEKEKCSPQEVRKGYSSDTDVQKNEK